jgi:hypothetical protein
MKKVKFSQKLSLNKENISKLNAVQMNQLNGGEDLAGKYTCNMHKSCTTCVKKGE